jgi:hypothetical protein
MVEESKVRCKRWDGMEGKVKIELIFSCWTEKREKRQKGIIREL